MLNDVWRSCSDSRRVKAPYRPKLIIRPTISQRLGVDCHHSDKKRKNELERRVFRTAEVQADVAGGVAEFVEQFLIVAETVLAIRRHTTTNTLTTSVATRHRRSTQTSVIAALLSRSHYRRDNTRTQQRNSSTSSVDITLAANDVYRYGILAGCGETRNFRCLMIRLT